MRHQIENPERPARPQCSKQFAAYSIPFICGTQVMQYRGGQNNVMPLFPQFHRAQVALHYSGPLANAAARAFQHGQTQIHQRARKVRHSFQKLERKVPRPASQIQHRFGVRRCQCGGMRYQV